MDTSSISKLASLLRESGDKVLNALSKLSLSVSLLQDLNEAFCLIAENEEEDNSSFQVIKTNNSKVEFFHDLQFLHDFIQKALGLKISHNPLINESIKSTLDISKFKSIKILELRKVPINLVSGIQGIRAQLQSIICVRCLQKLEDLLSNCGADHSSGFIWSELREAVFSYNSIESLDSSLGYAPWLQIIDLSHNRIKNIEAINCLPNLKYLNISYNLLESVPVFSKSTCRRLQVLVLKNNYIDNLSGLSNLENLSELDLSCNCLTDHDSLFPLLKLASLIWLSLEGNPLSFHSRHRFRTVNYLHHNTAFVKFVLDRNPLSKSERLVIGTVSSSPVQRRALIYGDNISSHSASSASTSTKTQVPEQLEQQSSAAAGKSQSRRKTKKVREAVIAEHDGSVEDETETLIGSLETSLEHLETKRQIETLREQFGEDTWLIQRGGTCVQDVLGLPRTISSEPTLDLSIEIGSSNGETQKCPQEALHPEPTASVALPNVLDTSRELAPPQASEDHEVEVEVEEDDEEMEEDDEAEQQLYTVQRLFPGTQRLEELFLAVTDSLLKEREAHSGRTRERWAMDTLQSCVRTCNTPIMVQLTFDTVRRDRREREYIMEEADAQKLVRTLGSILDSRSLSAMNQVPYRCMKCSTQFSQEVDSKNVNTVMVPENQMVFSDIFQLSSDASGKVLTCPSCGSKMVIEMDEEPLPAQRALMEGQKCKALASVAAAAGLPQSPSQSSIGSAASLDSPSNASVAATRRYDSDIEVISNPSQSSIEVLDGESRTPGRKRSEERQTPTVSHTTVTPQSIGHALTVAGLTESSSSGSLTDSVCTTYEHQPLAAPVQVTEEKTKQNGSTGGISILPKQKEETIIESNESPRQSGIFSKPHSPVKDFTTIFEGLLQSVSNKLIGATNPSSCAASASSAMTYSYTDFGSVDHRLKLHLYQHILEGEFEELVLLLRADVLPQTAAQPFPGCLVLSTHKVHILKVTGLEGDDPEQWLSKVESYTLDQLVALFVLPWNQGVGVQLQTKSILFLVQDQQRTSNFFTFISDALLPRSCLVTSEPPDYHQLALRQLILSCAPSGEADSAVRVLAIFNSCTVNGEVAKLGMGAVIVTATDLFLTQSDLHWLFPANNSLPIQAHSAQKMNDLIEVELDGLTLGLQFMDEAAGEEESWSIVLQTDSAVQTVITAIQVPWEQLFSVPLQVTDKTIRS